MIKKIELMMQKTLNQNMISQLIGSATGPRSGTLYDKASHHSGLESFYDESDKTKHGPLGYQTSQFKNNNLSEE